MSPPMQTRWRLVATRDLPRLDVELVVDTVAPAVTSAIEAAATRAGIVLERIEVPDDIVAPIVEGGP